MLHVERAANDARPLALIRAEITAELWGRPHVVIGWFSPADPEVGILRPAFVSALAVDADGVVADLFTLEQLEALMPRLRSVAEEE